MSARAEKWIGENQLGKSMLSELGAGPRISVCRRFAISGLSDEPSDSIAATIRLVVLPSCIGLTVLNSELAFGTRTMREDR